MSFNAESTHPYIMNSRIKAASGTGGISNIPIASAETLGGIKIGGSANPITITGSGNASVRKATSELLGVVKAGDGVSIDAGGAISGVAYSTTEHKIGRKWVDGKDIYEKTIDIGALPNETEKAITHNILYDTVISMIGTAKKNDGVTIPLPCVSTTPTNCILLSINSETLKIESGTDRTAFSGMVTVMYTKPTTP